MSLSSSGTAGKVRLTRYSAIVAHPTEIIKCKLQLQLIQPDHMPKEFSGPVDVVRKTVAAQGITGMWRGLPASYLYRSSFLAMFGGQSSHTEGKGAGLITPKVSRYSIGCS